MPRHIAVMALVALFAFTAHSLVSGAAFLEVELPGGLPIGNALSALGFCSLAAVSVILAPPRSPARVFANTALLASACWLPASIALAGNLSLNFVGSRGAAWLALTVSVAVLLVASLGWSAWLQIRSFLRRAGSSAPAPSARAS